MSPSPEAGEDAEPVSPSPEAGEDVELVIHTTRCVWMQVREHRVEDWNDRASAIVGSRGSKSAVATADGRTHRAARACRRSGGEGGSKEVKGIDERPQWTGGMSTMLNQSVRRRSCCG